MPENWVAVAEYKSPSGILFGIGIDFVGLGLARFNLVQFSWVWFAGFGFKRIGKLVDWF